MTTDQYLNNINQRYKLGNATEHTFRGDLQQLLESLVPDIRATNEPKRQSCGAPDYILTKKDIPVGFIEAKDIGDKDLDGLKRTGNKEQFDRYKASLDNLIFTDYLNFHLYREGEFITKIAIGEITEKGIRPLPENFETFENLIKVFSTHIGQNIKSSKKLAKMMAGKARLLSDIIGKALVSDEDNAEDSTLKDQMLAFKQILIHDITPQGFADVYAQTIAYGMFAARLHDTSLDNFTRQEAAELIPKSNPFLRKLFGYISGPDIDDRIKWIVDSLADVFLATNVEEILKNYGKSTKMEDPIIHFYETFLSEYDPKLRKSRGVWYTPQPVVDFIVRAVDDILKTEFDLPQGLADTSKTTIKVNTQTPDKRSPTGFKQVEEEVHKVQILDPATGTGTFLAEVVKHIHKKFEGQQGIWSNYVETHLLPRLNGFELLMASYAMAHLKLDLLLTETGYKSTTPPFGHPSKGREQRLRIYLTNSLEEHHADTGTLFANWLSTEANEANRIKRDTPVMCIIGNPPYSGESANKGEWIMELMEDYKKEPGGKERLKEQNSKFINDDYVKFIRYGQHFIEKNGSGVLAYINPHGFLDNPTFRGMRWHLLKTFDKIYTIDLHGNAKKRETTPDGSADVNVFDIEQGVSINIFVKTGEKKPNELGQVFHYDLFGQRDFKYDFLLENALRSVPYKKVEYLSPHFFFIPKDFEEQKEYDKGFSILQLHNESSLGVLSKNDDITIDFDKSALSFRINDFINLNVDELRKLYNVKNDSRDWILSNAKDDLEQNYDEGNFKNITYRPFDNRWTYFTGRTKGFFAYSQNRIMKNMRTGDNFALISGRQGQAVGNMQWNLSFITNTISDQNIYRRGGGTVFPLYLYPDPTDQQTINPSTERTPNLNPEIVKQIAEKLNLTFVPEKHSPPLEGWSKTGVAPSPLEGWSKTGVAPSPLEGWSKTGVAPPPPGEASSSPKVLTTINNIPILRNFVEDLPRNPSLGQLAKKKRKEGILSEVLFWQQVHKGNFHNIDFDRQRVIGNYIVDFYVKSLGLIIEIDGSSHDDKVEYDAKREAYLVSLGLKMYRIADGAVKKNLNVVMQELEEFIVREYGGATPVCDHPSRGGETTPVCDHPSRGGETTPVCDHPSGGGEFASHSGGEFASHSGGEFAPIDLLDYIYAVLHSPTYREKYKEFLKIDFPRVPYPKDAATFWQLVQLGGEIRQIHLLESATVENYITQYPVDGDNMVRRRITKNSPGFVPTSNGLGKVYINDEQYFDNVPEVAWEFYIGGYQPAQKWLKDRTDRTLEFDDILHYQKIIVALSETDRLMKEIDEVEIE